MKYFISVLCIFVCTSTLFSQVINVRYGKVSIDELNMLNYKPDSTAAAVVIYETGFFSYETVKKNFQTTFEVTRKIKIFKKEGTDRDVIVIPYHYVNEENKASVTDIEAIAYNLELGKIVSSKVNKKDITDEKFNEQMRQVKFTIPNVKTGTVIEYKYKIISPQTNVIPSWNMQCDIPVMNSQFEALIPEYYQVEVDAKRGYEKINSEEFVQPQAFATANGNFNSKSRLMKFTAKNLPAIKNIPLLSYTGDCITGVRITVKGMEMPNSYYEPYYQDWGTLERTLMMDSVFGSNLRMANPFKVETRAVTGYVSTEKEKLYYVFNFIKNRIKWNGVYDFWGNNPRDAVRNCIGNNAQINVLLISALRDLGFKVYPVFVGLRSHGRLPERNPRVEDISTFIVCAELSTKERVFMDASGDGLNMLPLDLVTDKAYMMSPTLMRNKWVDLNRIAINQQVTTINATLNESGQLNADLTIKYTNELLCGNKNNSSDNFQNKYNVRVTNYIKNIDYVASTLTEKMNFSKKMDSGNYIYINPLFFLHMDKNPIEDPTERKMPVEFDYPYFFTVTTSLNLPLNYEIVKLPLPSNVQLKNTGAILTYDIMHENQDNKNVIKLKYHFKLNKTVYSGEEMDTVFNFLETVVQKNAEEIVLRKR